MGWLLLVICLVVEIRWSGLSSLILTAPPLALSGLILFWFGRAAGLVGLVGASLLLLVTAWAVNGYLRAGAGASMSITYLWALLAVAAVSAMIGQVIVRDVRGSNRKRNDG